MKEGKQSKSIGFPNPNPYKSDVHFEDFIAVVFKIFFSAPSRVKQYPIAESSPTVKSKYSGLNNSY
jgi:hypothetical protein